MKGNRARFISSAFLPAAGFALLLAFGASASVLEWKNGEKVGGGIVTATDSVMTWRVDPARFGEPLELQMHVLRSIDLRPDANKDWSKDEPTQEPFSIRLDDGTRLFGTILGMDGKNLTIRSPRFGTVGVALSAVTAVQRMSGADALLAGPGARQGWKPDQEDKKHLWRHVPGGFISQVGWNRSSSFELDLPERVELRIRLRSSERPEFKIELASSDKERCIVETWDDEIVLQGREFTRLTTLAKEQRHVTLGLFWDRKTGLCALYDGAGHKLSETKMPAVDEEVQETAEPEEKPPPQLGGLFGAILGMMQAKVAVERPQLDVKTKPPLAGLTLLNKGADLTLQEVLLREWSGKLPAEISEAVPRVELMDGRVLKGRIVKADGQTFTVDSAGSGKTTLPWAQLASVHLAAMNESGDWFGLPEVTVAYGDGMWMKGRLVSMTSSKIQLRTNFAPEPLELSLKGAQRIDLHAPVPEDAEKPRPMSQLDHLVVNKASLHGTLEADGSVMPRWKPVGAVRSVPILAAPTLEITRAEAGDAPSPADALFYLKNGLVVPGILRAMDERRLDVESAFVSMRDLKTDEINAVHFSGEPLNPDGFKDRGWRRIRGGPGEVVFEGGNLSMKPGGSLAHPGFSQVNEITFNLESNGFTAVRLRLFTSGSDPSGKSINLLFGHMGSELIFGVETSGDQMDTQNRVAAPRSVPVKILITEKTTDVSANGVPVRKVPVNAKLKSGSGVIIEPFSLWGNGEREGKLTKFAAKVGPGQLALPAVDAKAREHALLVPRFRKESPPKHILIAHNGDLLRGIVEAGTGKHFALRSGLETVQVPADRVTALVWLTKPDAKEETPVSESKEDGNYHLILSNGGRLDLKLARFDEDAVIGSHPRLGDVHVPLSDVHIIRSAPSEDSALMAGFRDWKLAYTPEPVLPESGGESSPILNKDAPTFALPLLAGGEIDLAKEKGKVVVLDFWATWCGPCVKSLPDMIAKMGEFDSTKVRFVAVNQAEQVEQIKSFLDTRGWKMEVALDAFQRTGQQFGVEGIPHTVVIGPDGKVAFVKTGYSPDGAEQIAEAIRKLLK